MTELNELNGSREEPNRLIRETSPYLIQHAYNPVDWYAWGGEALQRARDEDKPIFLSVGYSACHWCHVMEHECFENPEIAELMNELFINIKVDREERPDLDQIYMAAVQLITRRGGWPMSVFLSPDLKPFYGGTYWPPENRGGMPGFPHVLRRVHAAWSERRNEVLSSADEITAAVQQMVSLRFDPADLSAEILEKATQQLVANTDTRYGGFGSAPKFPHAMDLRVLLRGWQRFGNTAALDAAILTLDRMARGGIYDHLGGGFHRYSTDERWLVPHFEKMLYDNALLVPAYLEAYQITKRNDFATVVRETLDYVLREMTQSPGGFYSTQDADSEGEEGRYFVWHDAQLDDLLGAEKAAMFGVCYDVTPPGNWEGKTIFNRSSRTHAAASAALGIPEDQLSGILAECRATLLRARGRRVPPDRDDKILVSWNGMMISAMSQAAVVLGEPRYAVAAAAAADFILQSMLLPNAGLQHSFKDGQARFPAYLDDYACLIDGLVDLYQANFDAKYLSAAIMLAQSMLDRFSDPDNGGFFYTAIDHEQLIARSKDVQDSSTPSGNSMAATALLRLGRITGRTEFEKYGRETLVCMSGMLHESPAASGQGLLALDFLLGPTTEIVIVDGKTGGGDGDKLLRPIHDRFFPRKVMLRRPNACDDDQLPAAVSALVAGKLPTDSAAAYVCRQGTCSAPVSTETELQRLLDE